MRLYKIQITEVPTECDDLRYFIVHDNFVEKRREWKPEGWEDYVAERIAAGTNWKPDQHFFWPSEDKFYRSRSTAREKQLIVERWGGKAIILEAEVSEFIPVAEANKRRKIARLKAELERLEQA